MDPLTRLIAGVLPFFPKEDPGDVAESERLYTAYPVWPVGALTELQAYMREADAALPRGPVVSRWSVRPAAPRWLGWVRWMR